jgi:hypothetical protein
LHNIDCNSPAAASLKPYSWLLVKPTFYHTIIHYINFIIMQHAKPKPLKVKVAIFSTSFLLFLATVIFFCSFKTARMADDFLKQLGISKTAADAKITDGILGGGIDLYGVKNARNIALGNRKAVVLDLVAYAKAQANAPNFIKQYNDMRNRLKTEDYVPQTPEKMRAETIARAKEGVAQIEEAYKKADAAYKAVFLKSVEDAKKYLKDVEDPKNKQFVRYSANYERAVQEAKEGNARKNAEFEKRFPTNHVLYVKMRLLEFMDETKDIDFDAELISKNGKKYFVNRAYESKGSRWKMAFRAGKEVIEPAREAVQKWIEDIK